MELGNGVQDTEQSSHTHMEEVVKGLMSRSYTVARWR